MNRLRSPPQPCAVHPFREDGRNRRLFFLRAPPRLASLIQVLLVSITPLLLLCCSFLLSFSSSAPASPNPLALLCGRLDGMSGAHQGGKAGHGTTTPQQQPTTCHQYANGLSAKCASLFPLAQGGKAGKRWLQPRHQTGVRSWLRAKPGRASLMMPELILQGRTRRKRDGHNEVVFGGGILLTLDYRRITFIFYGPGWKSLREAARACRLSDVVDMEIGEGNFSPRPG